MPKNLAHLSDSELICSLKSLVRDERGRLVLVLRHLAAVDERRLAVGAGYPSLFDYCVRELRYAQGEAARRIQAARAAAKYPILYRALDRGLLSLTSVSLLSPHLKRDNHRRLIREALGRSTREIEALVAAMTSAPEPCERVRYVAPEKLENSGAPLNHEDLFQASISAANEPARLSASAPPDLPASGSAGKSEQMPEPPRRVHFSFTADEALLRDVERAKELLRHKCPTGKLEGVFAEALRALLKDIDPERRFLRRIRRPRAKEGSGAPGRAIPRRVRNEVWRRDGGRCAFFAPDGRLCGSRAGLEVDHVRPWAQGGVSDDANNLRLLCRAHNQLAARRAFGDAHIDAAIARSRRSLTVKM